MHRLFDRLNTQLSISIASSFLNQRNCPTDHSSMDAQPHYLEIVQKTRNRLQSGELTHGELGQSMMLVRFVPYRMERYVGGPEQVMWERWEWKRDNGGDLWEEPKRLLPY